MSSLRRARAAVRDGGKSIEDRYQENKEQEEDFEKEVAQKESAAKKQKELDDTINNIVMFFTDNRDNRDILKPIMKAIKDMGYSSPKEIDNIDDADKIMKLIDEA